MDPPAYDLPMDLNYETRPDHLLVTAAGEFDHVAAKQGMSTIIRAGCDITRPVTDGAYRPR